MTTKKNSAGTWCVKLAVVLALALLYCGVVPQNVYAEKNTQVVKPPDKANQKAPAGIVGKAAATELPKELPTLTVTLHDEDGLPISGVSLAAIEADFTAHERGSATTDENGKAVFRNLRSGAYYFYANFNAIRRHAGYGMPAMIRAFKSSRIFYISESRKFDLSANAEATYIVKRGAYILFETYLQTVRSGKVIIMNEKNGIEQIIPVASTDYMQIYLPMRSMYKIVTIKDNDFDSWILEFYAHERLRIELL
ncbi:MAG: carboxypeptidase-like regulatory domain-containing protein [Negativicutes bacterium]